MSVGSSAAYTIVGYWESCYHQQWSMNISPYGWNVNAPGVASLASQYPGGHATGQGEGTTDFAGWWGVERWEPYIEDCVVDAWSWEQPGAAQVFSVAQSPTRIEMSTGDTNVTISSLVSPSTSVQRTFTTNLVFNDYSSCSAGISIGSVTGSGTQSHGITPSNAGCSGKFTATAHAGGGSTPSGNTTDVFIPPQRLIQMMRGEANAYSEVTQFSVGRVAKNRIGDSGFGSPSTWQAAISAEFQGTDTSVTTGVSPELGRAVALFEGSVGDIVGGCKCMWSPTASEWGVISAALASGTTTSPPNSQTGAPGCYGDIPRQIVVKNSVEQHHSRNAPAFVFLRPREVGSQPAVVSIP